MSSNKWTGRSWCTEMRAVPQSKISRTFRSAVSRAFDKRDYVEDLAANSQTGLAKLTQNRKWLPAALNRGDHLKWSLIVVARHPDWQQCTHSKFAHTTAKN